MTLNTPAIADSIYWALFHGKGATVGWDGEVLTSGYACSLWPSLEVRFSADTCYEPNQLRLMVHAWVVQHVEEHRPAEADGLGVWYDCERHQYVLDVIAVFPKGKLLTALKASHAANQKAIWSLDDDREMEVDPDGYDMWEQYADKF